MPSMRLCETEMVQNEDECVEGFKKKIEEKIRKKEKQTYNTMRVRIMASAHQSGRRKKNERKREVACG